MVNKPIKLEIVVRSEIELLLYQEELMKKGLKDPVADGNLGGVLTKFDNKKAIKDGGE